MSVNQEQPLEQEPLTYSQRRWELVRQSRFQVADEIDRLATDFHAQVGSSLRAVTLWLRGPAEYAEALAQPLVLAIGLALTRSNTDPRFSEEAAESLSESPSIGDWEQEVAASSDAGSSDGNCPPPGDAGPPPRDAGEIQQAVRWAIREVIGRQKAANWRIFSLMLYPILTLLTAWTLWVAASFILFPSIEDIFDEFGISLPAITQLLLSSSATVRQWWIVMLLIPFVYLALFIGLNYLSAKRSGDRGTWLDRQLAGKRIALAKWAWHLSLLLEWGLASKSAVMIAGMCSHRGWLQQCCLNWIGASRNSTLPANLPPETPQTDGLPSRVFIPKARFQLVNHTMSLPDGLEKILLLREIGTYYQEKSSTFIEWLLTWLSTLLIWFALGMIAMILYSIYSPLFALIGGLTGGLTGF